MVSDAAWLLCASAAARPQRWPSKFSDGGSDQVEDAGMTKRIGFIGVGLMGHGMAKNLVEKGFDLTVLGHRNREPVEDLKRRGAKEAGSAAELAGAVDILFLCVTGTPQVEEVVLGANGIRK